MQNGRNSFFFNAKWSEFVRFYATCKWSEFVYFLMHDFRCMPTSMLVCLQAGHGSFFIWYILRISLFFPTFPTSVFAQVGETLLVMLKTSEKKACIYV